MNDKTTFCNCALPALTGNTECCKYCRNNPNPDIINSNIEWICNIPILTKCPHCGKEFLFNDAIYCPYCGKELNPKPTKCKSYHTQKNRHYFTEYEKGFRAGMGLSYKEYEIREEGRCYGTKECEPCSCGGDETKCDFYPEKRNWKKLNEDNK